MNSDFPQNEREQLEAKVTALLLGELSAEDAAAFGNAMEQDAELKALYERLKVTIELVREGAVNPAAETATRPVPLKMSAERREKLLAGFKTIAPEEFKPKRRLADRLVPWAAAAAVVMVFGLMAIPNFSASRETAKKNSIINNLRLLDGAEQQWALENNKSEGTPKLADLGRFMGRGGSDVTLSSVAGEKYVPGSVTGAPMVEMNVGEARRVFGRDAVAAAEVQDGKVRLSLDTIRESERGSAVQSLGLFAAKTRSQPAQTAAKDELHVWSSSLSGVLTTNGMSASVTPRPQIALPMSDQVARNGRGETTTNSWDFSATTGEPSVGALGQMNSEPSSTEPLNYAKSADISEALRKLAGEGTNTLAMNGGTLTVIDSGMHIYHAAPDRDSNQINFIYSNMVAGGSDRSDVPVLGDVPGMGQAFRSQSTFSSYDGSTNAVQQLDDARDDNGKLPIFLPSQSRTATLANNDSLLLQRESQGITTPGGFGGGGRAEALTKNPSGQFPSQSSVVVNAKFAEVNQQSNGAFGFNWYAGQYTNGVTVAGGTMPQPVQVAKADNAPAEYRAAQEDLESKKRWREILQMKTGQEAVDKESPKVPIVSVMDSAKAELTEKPGWGQKLKESLSGKVERTARIIVAQEKSDIAGLAVFSASQAYDPYFLQTEIETIQSHAVLSNVVASLDLKDVWGKKYNDGQPMSEANAEALIKKNLDLSAVKNTKFIEIGVRDESPEEAARLANAVAQAYQKYRMDEYDSLKSHGIVSLQQQLTEQDAKIKLAQANVDRLAKGLETSRGAVPAVTQKDAALPKPVIPPPTPQPEILTRENAVSTFSLNVSDVSFKLAAASLKKGQMPEPASIRSEEFINAFDYRDPDAGPGVPIAFASERARYPFAHNRELLRFSLKTAAAGRQAGRPLNIVLLLDNSGSMERADRVRIIQEALRVLASQLKPSDTFSIVTFARTAQLRVDGVPGNQAAAAAAEIAKLTPEGGTNLGEALDLAYATALHHYLPKGDNRVVVLTDGAANLGDVEPEKLKQKVEAHRKQGVALDCFGIGWEGYNDDLLEVLTRNGDGRYGFINSPEEASTTFVSQVAGALHVAAADVKVQVEFNPKRVTSYRQIGYAKHQLTKEQFRDNTVDAAEIAAQEAGNALYTIETNPQGEGSIATVRVRYKVPGTGEYREQAWDVPYTGSAVALEQASPAMRLAATASAFSEWLAGSPFASGVTTDQLLNYLKGVSQVYGADTRPKDLEWMVRQAKSISGE